MKEITGYQTEDGVIFDNFVSAAHYEITQKIDKLLEASIWEGSKAAIKSFISTNCDTTMAYAESCKAVRKEANNEPDTVADTPETKT